MNQGNANPIEIANVPKQMNELTLPPRPNTDESPIALAKERGISVKEAKQLLSEARRRDESLAHCREEVARTIRNGLLNPREQSECHDLITKDKCSFYQSFAYRIKPFQEKDASTSNSKERWVALSRVSEGRPFSSFDTRKSSFGVLVDEILTDYKVYNLEKCANKGREYARAKLSKYSPELAQVLAEMTEQGIEWELFSGGTGLRTFDAWGGDYEHWSFVELAVKLPAEKHLLPSFREEIEQERELRANRKLADTMYRDAQQALDKLTPLEATYSPLLEVPEAIVEKDSSCKVREQRSKLLKHPAIIELLERFEEEGTPLTLRKVRVLGRESKISQSVWTIGVKV